MSRRNSLECFVLEGGGEPSLPKVDWFQNLSRNGGASEKRLSLTTAHYIMFRPGDDPLRGSGLGWKREA